MDKLPKDIAEAMKECASKAAEAAANERFGSKGESDAAKVMFNDYAGDFTKKASDLLSNSAGNSPVCEDIKWMFWNAAWATANERKGYTRDAANDQVKMEEHYQNIVSSNLMKTSLVDNIKWMGWNLGWYWANTKYGYTDDAIRDEAKYKSHFDKVQGEANLIGMNFFIDQAKVMQAKPLIVAEQVLINDGDIENAMAFTFSVTEGKTSSLSNSGSFSYGVTLSFEAGFVGLASEKYEASFDVTKTKTVSESLTTGKTKTYNFSLNVPAHATYNAKATVHEADMDVPYELVFKIGDTKKTIQGIWKGVATSKATYEITKVKA